MNVIEEILKWSETRPPWQRDALRRLWVQNSLTQTDKDEVLSLIKKEHELDSPEGSLVPIPLSKDHIASPAASSPPTILRTMHGLQNVNALTDGQRIEFASSGLTVIYGENAAGKSGYSRVLKRACRARGSKETIHPNVFAKGRSQGAARSSFDVTIDNHPQTVSWVDGAVPPDCLSDIAVFDSKCARVYVDQATDVAYIPFGLDVLTRLARLCIELRTKIQGEISALGDAPAIVTTLTGDGRLIPTLTAKTPIDQVQKQAMFSPDDGERLKKVTAEIADLAANDPIKTADRKRRLAKRVDALRAEVSSIKKAISRPRLLRMGQARVNMITARAAAQLASAAALSNEPLAGTGGDAWRLMFEAARRFSEDDAYRGQEFPMTSDEALCLLCQQPLAKDAKERLERFGDFVQQDTARVAKESHDTFMSLKSSFKGISTALRTADSTLVDELREVLPQIDQILIALSTSLHNRFSSASAALEDGDWSRIPDTIDDLNPALSRLSKDLFHEAKETSRLNATDRTVALEKERAQLEERRQLALNKDVIVGHIQRLADKEKLRGCYDVADATWVTRKQVELTEKALTKELRDSLNRELVALGVTHLQLRVDKSGESGATLHRLAFAIDDQIGPGLSEILSEGEHRVVAIASFLAELGTSHHRCGIVFDDPVNSLDHLWRGKIASRLAFEARNRQVIIFTHDVFFLLSLQQEAALNRVCLKIQAVSRLGNQVGLCRPDQPVFTMNVKDRCGYLRNQIVLARQAQDGLKVSAYEKTVHHFYGTLRAAWERAIEELLFGEVTVRFRQNIEVLKLRYVEVSADDCSTIILAWEKCSARIEAHDQSAGALLPKPTIEDMTADLSLLERFRDTIKGRRKTNEDHWMTLKSPPSAAE